MKSAPGILAALRERELFTECERIAKEHAISLEREICDMQNRNAEVCEARHAVWRFLIDHFGGAAMPVARLWGCHPSSLVYAETRLEIVQVVLATFEDPAGRAKYQFEYARRKGGRFGVNDLVAARTTWFQTYQLAHEVYTHVCEEAGELTFRTHAAADGAS